MGYETNYELKIEYRPDANVAPYMKVVIDTKALFETVSAQIEKDLQRHFRFKYSDNTGTAFAPDIKWYEHEEDMKLVSGTHSDILFILEGTGADPGDYWRKYFYRGKMHKATLTFSPFNPDELR